MSLNDLPIGTRLNTLRNLPKHLSTVGEDKAIVDVLSNFEFIKHKIRACSPFELLDDYQFTTARGLEDIRKAIELATHVFLLHPQTSIESQLYARLSRSEYSESDHLLEQIDCQPTTWFLPILSGLTATHTPLVSTLRGHDNNVTAMALEPSNKHLISVCRDGFIKLWDMQTYRELATIRAISEPLIAVAYLRNDQIVVASEDNMIALWDYENRHQVCPSITTEETIRQLVAWTDSPFFCSAFSTSLMVWKVVDEIQPYWSLAFESPVTSCALSTTGHLVTGHDDGYMAVWSVSEREHEYEWQAVETTIVALAVHADTVVILDEHLWVTVWRLSGELVNQFTYREYRPSKDYDFIALAYHGRYAISTFSVRGKQLRIVDLETGVEHIQTEGHSWRISDIVITTDATQFLTSSQDARIKVWTLKDSIDSLAERLQTHTDDVTSLCVLDDIIITTSLDGTAAVWDIADGTAITIMKIPGSFIYSVQVSYEQGLIALGGYPGSVSIWDLETYQKIVDLPSGMNSVVWFALAEDGTTLYSHTGRRLIEWSLADSFADRTLLEVNAGYRLGELAISPHNAFVVTHLSTDQPVTIHLNTKSTTLHEPVHQTPINVLLPLNEETFLSASQDGQMIVWHVDESSPIRTIASGLGTIKDVKPLVSGDEGQVIVAGDAGKLEIWDIVTATQVSKLEGHAHIVNQVQCSSDGRYAISISVDESLILWDLASQKILAQMSLENRPVACDFSPDGTHIVIGEIGGNVSILRIMHSHN